MQIFDDPKALQQQCLAWREEGLRIGFVPTMGYLHEGHLSLIKTARSQADKLVVSTFVNPTQFGPNEDLEAYPHDEERDRKLTEEAGVDVLFRPTPATMYEADAATWVEVPALAKHLCGAARPIHFRGVCTVVAKLFHIVQPHFACFGEKDWQQLAVLRRMVRDLMFPIELIGCPIIREEDGLAKSSRNAYLTPDERKEAPAIYRALQTGAALAKAGEGSAAKILTHVRHQLEKSLALGTIEYLELVERTTLEPLETVNGNGLLALAVKFPSARLIDNCRV